MYLFQPERVNVPGQVTCIYIPPCIYFNHAPSQNQAVFLLTFTFHYVSISTDLNRPDIQVEIDLHSTMYLFQPLEIQHRAQYQSNLHSTMYLFQPIVDSTARVSVWDLHSTMYLFQQGQTYTEVWASAYLHSTMYLFQPTAKKIIKDYYLFTFHYASISTCFQINQIHFLPNLHSTMYLFQLLPLTLSLILSLVFTFHYVPISTGETVVSTPLLLVFTFHYVSIST